MKKGQIQEGKINYHAGGLGVPTPEMIEARARELAVISGRPPDKILSSDLEEARLELTGQASLSNEEPEEEAILDANQWDPAPGTPGTRAHTVVAADEQTNVEKYVEEGVEEAEHDLMFDHSRDSLEEDKES